MRELVREILKANYHRGGLKCCRLFRLEAERLREIREELLVIAPLSVRSNDHRTAYTKPYGAVRQFSLYNRSGRLDDRSTDYDPNPAGKHFPLHLPNVARLFSRVPDLLNLRLNCLGRNSGLSDHEEEVFVAGGNRLRLRFHLPIITNPLALVSLDGEAFHFAEGEIHFFNNGCVHAANNQGEADRYHLVWDVLLTEKSFDFFFGDRRGTSDLRRIADEDRALRVFGSHSLRNYETARSYSQLYERLGLGQLGLSEKRFRDLYNRIAYLRTALPGGVEI